MGADADLCKGVGGLCLVYARKYKSLNGMGEVGIKNAIKLHAHSGLAWVSFVNKLM